MKVNDFNSRVNLPKFCARLGYTDYQYVRVPTFGWFAYNKDKTFVGNIFDVVGQKDRDQIFSLITKDKPEFLDFELAYSDHAEKTLRNNLMLIQLWSAAFAFARKEMESYMVNFKGKREKLKLILQEQGFAPLLTNNIGVITKNVLERFNMLPWPKATEPLRGKLMIATFHSPMHISSLEVCSWDNPSELQTLFLNTERGWYGDITKNNIVGSVFDLWTNAGSTWDYKSDYWLGTNIVDFDDAIDVGTLIRIWTEAKNTTFSVSPLEHIVAKDKVEDLKHHVGQFNLQQLEEAEKVTGHKLVDYWKKARELEVVVGKRHFVKRNNCYYVYSKDGLEQITNFAIDIDKIVKRGDRFYRVGMLHFGDKSAPFELDEKYFGSSHIFLKAMKIKFLHSGLGVPLVYSTFAYKALLLIDSFNSGVPIEMDDDYVANESSEHSQLEGLIKDTVSS
jgi:hypothetical protein